MRHVRMLGLCLAAVFAVAAVAATSASALPEWGKCVVQPAHEGKYTDSNCTKKAKKVNEKFTGEFEFKKGAELANVPFTGESAGSGGVLYAELAFCGEGLPGRVTRQQCEAEGKSRKHEGFPQIECTGEKAAGEASGKASVIGVHVTFVGCKLFGAVPCDNGAPEEVKTNTLKGSLGYINKATKEVGVLLEPATKKGAFAQFVCHLGELGEEVGVGNSKQGAAHTTSGCDQACPGATPLEETHGGYDGVISPITPVNQMTSTFTQEYKVQGQGSNETCPENIPNHFAGKHIELLEVTTDLVEKPSEKTMWSCSAEEITSVQTPSEPGEIKA